MTRLLSGHVIDINGCLPGEDDEDEEEDVEVEESWEEEDEAEGAGGAGGGRWEEKGGEARRLKEEARRKRDEERSGQGWKIDHWFFGGERLFNQLSGGGLIIPIH